jgi:hypothetical protein
MNSKAIPIESINLNGAKLVALTGGGAKRRDLQKGFAIIGCSGKKSFFIAETFAQYEKWVTAIQKSLSTLSMSTQNNNLKDRVKFDVVVDGDIIESEGEIENEFAIDDMQPDNDSIADSQSMISEEDIERTKKLNLREKAKNRMSQTITAVKKNVKLDTNTIRQLNNGAFQNMNVGRKPNNVNNITRLPDMPSLKLRGLKYGTAAPVVKEQIVHTDQEMCVMIGVWAAKMSFNTKMEDQQNTIASGGKINIELKCLEWKEVDDKPADILVSKKFSELMKFHSDLSDALLTIRRNVEITGLTLTNKDYNDLFSQVLHSGRLMKGMLDHLLKGNNLFFTESICKFDFQVF